MKNQNPIDLLSPERRLEVLTEAARALVVQHVAARSTLSTFAKAVAQSPFSAVKLADLLFPVPHSGGKTNGAFSGVKLDVTRALAPSVPVRVVVRDNKFERPARRSAKQIAARCEAVMKFVQANPGANCEAIKAKLGAAGINDALDRLRAKKQVKVKGKARGTTYTAA